MKLLVPAIFGFTILIVWELVVRGLNVPLVILPPPSLIAETFLAKLPILWKDFVQTFVKGALSGYFIGCIAAVALAVLVIAGLFHASLGVQMIIEDYIPLASGRLVLVTIARGVFAIAAMASLVSVGMIAGLI